MRQKKLLVLLSIILIINACAKPSIPTIIQATPNSIQPTPTLLKEKPTSIPSPTVSPEISVKIISYNILVGGGIQPEWYEYTSDPTMRRDRTPEIFEYLRELDADVVALQEVHGWNDSTPPFIATAASELGLPNYYVAPSATNHDTAILTRFEILDVVSLYEAKGDPSIIRARLQTPDGKPLNIFVVHLDAFDYELQMRQLEQLTAAARPYSHERIIMLGDFNFTIISLDGLRATQTLFMEDAGYKLIARDSTLNRDHIWIFAESASWKVQSWFKPPKTPLSDHSPVGVMLDFYPLNSQ